MADEPDRPAEADVQFGSTAARYRRRFRLFLAALPIGALAAGASLVAGDTLFPWLASVGMALVVFAFLLFFTLPRLQCPACHHAADSAGPFCPVCGAPGIERAPITRPERCAACGHTLGGYKYRNWRLHYCRCCGTFLSARGI